MNACYFTTSYGREIVVTIHQFKGRADVYRIYDADLYEAMTADMEAMNDEHE